ncbi:hypothetical protein JAAARDRAFT_42791 [Jaapia argillacea MUCL 33604]|uniref:NADP-dependent oxidoreductase domain-containing protein n=1 Tax=Jaapia argillacea MUCL 33604 TaxID=933084 RepID=A0A067P3R8_9AGAM|nr:hypothetical protein JAAARDRAFT_42791 [Jaapia argillacea MUCL 33604]
MTTFPSFRLNNGVDIPALGIGCWMGYVPPPDGGDEITQMVEHALKIGYRHVDTAFNYGNEVQVGRGIRNSGVPRSELFVTTKLTSEHHGMVQEALQISLTNLGLEYIDLYLMHWPQTLTEDGKALQPDEHPNFIDTWKEMEKLLPTGRVRAIGVSNFSPKNLDILLPAITIVPAVNQVEMHPMLPQIELFEYCKRKSILLTAYSPLGKHKPAIAEHPSLLSITKEKGCTTAQVLLSWLVNQGVAVVPKSVHKERIEENLSFIDLSEPDLKALSEIHKAPGMHRSVCGFHGNGRMCFGWTYEQLGWPMKEGGIIW